MAETGILGFFLVFGCFLLIIYYSIKHLIFRFLRKKILHFNDFQICLISAMFLSLWPFSPSGSFFHNWLSIVYFLPVGMLMWQIDLKKTLKSEDIKT